MSKIEVDNDIPTDRIYYQKTNSKGVYMIARIEMGKEYWVFCYPPQDSDYALDLTPKKVKVTTQYPRADFELEVGGAISGTVYEADGVTRVKNVIVGAVSQEGVGYTKPDDNGNYKITNLKQGDQYMVVVIPDGYAAKIKRDIAVKSAQTTSNVNFTLSPYTTTSITGVVKSADTGQPINNGIVVIYEENEGGMNYLSADGSFKISGLKPQLKYNVLIYAEGYKIEERFDIIISEGQQIKLDFALKPEPEEISALQKFNGKINFSEAVREIFAPQVYAKTQQEICDCIKKCNDKYGWKCKLKCGFIWGNICARYFNLKCLILLVLGPEVGAVAVAICMGITGGSCRIVASIFCSRSCARDGAECIENCKKIP